MIRLIYAAGLAITLSACGGGDSTHADQNPASGGHVNTVSVAQNRSILAVIKGEPLTRDLIDHSIQLKLYDLEWAKYELRRAALATYIDQRLAKGNVQPGEVRILIEPPTPPRLMLEQHEQSQPVRGAQNAPVSIAVFCSYQSSHCARMQSIYRQLEEHYEELLRFVYYDFPQSFHRYARSAGNAARCANQLGSFWSFHQGVMASYNELNEALYPNLARQVNLPEEDFSRCLANQSFIQQVLDNTQLAESLGFKNVPVTLVNGLYLNGPKSFDTLRYFVDQELLRLGVSPKRSAMATQTASTNQGADQMQRSKLPLRLESAIVSNEPDMASALIRHIDNDQLVKYRPDDEVFDGIFVVMIEAERVIIENKGRLEVLPLMNSAGSLAEGQTLAEADEAEMAPDQVDLPGSSDQADHEQELQQENPYDPEQMAGAEYRQRGIVAAEGEAPLSRQWLQDQLQNQSQLAESFKPAALEVEGVHVLKLKGVEDNDFYKTLGLKEGDVVLRVNDEWVHEAQNNLFSLLESESQVSVVLMRKGLPVHYRYAIN